MTRFGNHDDDAGYEFTYELDEIKIIVQHAQRALKQVAIVPQQVPSVLLTYTDHHKDCYTHVHVLHGM